MRLARTSYRTEPLIRVWTRCSSGITCRVHSCINPESLWRACLIRRRQEEAWSLILTVLCFDFVVTCIKQWIFTLSSAASTSSLWRLLQKLLWEKDAAQRSPADKRRPESTGTERSIQLLSVKEASMLASMAGTPPPPPSPVLFLLNCLAKICLKYTSNSGSVPQSNLFICWLWCRYGNIFYSSSVFHYKLNESHPGLEHTRFGRRRKWQYLLVCDG